MYYICEVHPITGNKTLVLVHSKLDRELTTRLLLFAAFLDSDYEGGDVESITVIGEATATFYTDLVPHPHVRSIAGCVSPHTFNKDEEGRYWSLLNKMDAGRLLKLWRDESLYTDETSVPNYFKNQVDKFAEQMEKRWQKLKK